MRLDPRQCSQCGAILHAVTSAHGDGLPPEPGDLFVCLRCGARLVFDSVRRLRSLTPREFASLEPELRQKINAARRAVIENGGNMKRTWWLFVGPLALLACSNAGEAVMHDAGEVLRDAGELLSDAGEALADAGEALADASSDAAEAQAGVVEIPCDIVREQTSPNGSVTRWYAEYELDEDAEVDIWACDYESFSPPDTCEGCEGDGPLPALPCWAAQGVSRGDGKLRVSCGSRSAGPGFEAGQRWKTIRLRIR